MEGNAREKDSADDAPTVCILSLLAPVQHPEG